jgi:hypothetical protein
VSESRIVEKVRKLLALANSENEHEARAAAERAQRLMTKHNLDMQSVGYKDEGITEEAFAEADYLFHPRQYFVIWVVQEHFNVSCFQNREVDVDRATGRARRDGQGRRRFLKRMVFVGRQSNVAVAKDVYSFLDDSFKRLWAAYMRETGTTTGGQKSFFSGLQAGLDIQLGSARKQVEQENALVLVPDADLDAYMDAKKLSKGNALAGSRHDAAAYKRGVEEGKKLKIRRSVEQPKGPAGLRLTGSK